VNWGQPSGVLLQGSTILGGIGLGPILVIAISVPFESCYTDPAPSGVGRNAKTKSGLRNGSVGLAEPVTAGP
jgi:hypothetical protein